MILYFDHKTINCKLIRFVCGRALKRAITTGCGALDLLLDGGLPLGEVVLIYGEAETGKTTLAMQCATNAVRMGLKTLYVDSDGTFSPARLTIM